MSRIGCLDSDSYVTKLINLNAGRFYTHRNQNHSTTFSADPNGKRDIRIILKYKAGHTSLKQQKKKKKKTSRGKIRRICLLWLFSSEYTVVTKNIKPRSITPAIIRQTEISGDGTQYDPQSAIKKRCSSPRVTRQ
jgi:hypothetical protein